MDADAIDRLLGDLVPDDTGWRADVPAEAGRFLGRPVWIDLQTRHFPEDGPPPPPDEAKLSLARHLVAHLPEVLAVAEREYKAHATDWEVDPAEVADNPHLWFLLDEFEEAGPGEWAFVVGRSDWPDFGTHLEFDGLTFQDCWSGD